MTGFWMGGMHDYGASGREAAETRGRMRDAESRAREAEERLDRAMLACEAMWSLVRDKLGMTDLQLIERINELDMSDGSLDGVNRKGGVACPKCNRVIARRFKKCMYCGQPVQHDPFV